MTEKPHRPSEHSEKSLAASASKGTYFQNTTPCKGQLVMTDVNKKIERGIRAFLRQYREKSHVGKKRNEPEGVNYWSEQDAQFELLEKLRRQFKGKEYWVHAEGPLGQRREIKWRSKKRERSRRADIVITNLKKYKWWHEHWIMNDWNDDADKRFPRYRAVIEVKMLWRGLLQHKSKKQRNRTWIWSGYTEKNTLKRVRTDLRKLHDCLQDGETEEAHLILLDSVILEEEDKLCGLPYYSWERIRELKDYDRRIRLWHWPKSETRPKTRPKTLAIQTGKGTSIELAGAAVSKAPWQS